MANHGSMAKFTGQIWDGPISDAACSECGATKIPGDGRSWINELVEYQRGELVKRTGRFQCADCSRKEHAAYKAERKAQLAAMARCEVPGCNRRGTYRAGRKPETALLCGAHLKIARANHAKSLAKSGFAGMAIFMDTTPGRNALLKLASQKD